MLSTPDCGWTLFSLGKNERHNLSYLTDVAVDWLTQAIHGLETGSVFSVHGFCEPGRMICTVSFWSCYVIFEDDGPAPACEGVTHLHVNMLDFCRQLYADISKDIDAWVHWDDGFLETEPENADKLVEERRSLLNSMLKRLKEQIEKNEEYFAPDGVFF